jgi:hypothetical protein
LTIQGHSHSHNPLNTTTGIAIQRVNHAAGGMDAAGPFK